MGRRRHLWLLAALLLFGAAAWLMTRSEPDRPAEVTRDRIEFPRRLRPAESERADARRTLPPLTPERPAEPHAPPPRKRDPVLAALPAGDRDVAVVFEANAIRHSPVGQLLLDCLRAADSSDPIAELKERTGIDLLKDVDRVALGGETFVVSGHFAGVRWDEIARDFNRASYGEAGTLYRDSAHPEAPAFAVWRDELLLAGDHPAQLEQTIDRLEGRAPSEPPLIGEFDTYGEIYGALTGGALAHLLEGEKDELAQRLRALARRVELHVDASGDVAMVAEIKGDDATGLADLGRSIGGALSLARLKAAADGEKELAELLELARVVPGGGGGFTVELALPLPYIEKRLAFCRAGKADGGAAR